MVLCFKKRIEPFIFLFEIRRFNSPGTEKSFMERSASKNENNNINTKIKNIFSIILFFYLASQRVI